MMEDLSPAYEMPDQWPNPTSWTTDPATWEAIPDWDRNKIWDNVRIANGSTGYRLPTEAQWEYAAKGGNGSPGNYIYSGSNDPDAVGWYWGNSGGRTREIGGKIPNELGIYDMSGNVWEWCWGWWGYASDPSGSFRVLRGGSWGSDAQNLRSAGRRNNDPNGRSSFNGFRLVLP